LLEAEGVLFTAELAGKATGAAPLAGGSTVRISGICNVVTDERDSPRVPRSFKLLLRTASDVQVLKAPSWWTPLRTLWVVSGLMGIVLAAFGWVVFLRRRVREQTAVIRERLEQEIALQARYRELFENANDVILLYRADGQLVSVNRSAERVTGYSREDALTLNVADLVAPEHRPRVLEMLGETVRTGLSTTFEVDLIAREGHRVTLELDTHRTIIAGTQVGVQAIGRDVTERKRTEAALRQAKNAAESASRAKSEFVANVSHELRTPLNGIIGMTGLLMQSSLDEEQSQQIRMVKASAEALQHVVDNVLDFAKLEAGRLTLRDQPVDLRDCIAETLQSLAPDAREAGLVLSCRVAPIVPRVVVADPDRLRQVLTVLVGNAIKFTPRGSVHVDVDASFIDGARPEWLVTLRVTDTGIGIPLEKRDAIFEAFTQADGSMTRKHGGAGLGLAIASSLVRLMGGNISLESEVDRGSTFSVALPLIAQLQDGEEPRLARAAALVVDRDAIAREAVCERLERWGLAVTAAAGLDAAAAFLKTEDGAGCRIVVADADTLGGNLAAFVTMLRESSPAAKVIAGALAPRQQERDEALRCGAVAFLPKPYRDGELLAACRAALQPPAPAGNTTEARARPAPAAGTRPAVVLLVEDNVINQRVAEQILTRRGHQVRIAHNGRQAVDVLENWTPDLVFMDVQMPEMNGIDATRAIRAREAKRGGHMPIVALTAHAMPADREQCLRAGMDDCLTKPVSPAALTQTVERIVEQRINGSSNGAQHASSGAGPDPVLDPAQALERVDGDRELLGEIIDLFFQDIDALVQDLQRAVSERNAEAIMRTAHRLKGSVATFAAKPATEAALRLETMGRSGDVSGVDAAFSALQAELARLQPALRELRASH
ncbi:MAG TPA: response regulator, partial [Vicinamibacterales bacterium]|nr:response regulator [Vicinamibacterales bacterium]